LCPRSRHSGRDSANAGPHGANGNLDRIKQSRSRTLLGQFVPGIAQRADCERQTSTPDAPVQLIAQAGESVDTVVHFCPPPRRQTLPVLRGGRAFPWQRFERPANRSQRNTRALRHFDDRNTTEHVAGIPSLVSTVPPAFDEPLQFIEMKRGDGNATACMARPRPLSSHDRCARCRHSAGVAGERHVHGASKGHHRKDGFQFLLAIETFHTRRLDSPTFHHGGRADPSPSGRRRGLLKGNTA
jgi:hypothetical protein